MTAYKPFYITVATEQEKLGCMCSKCLNTRSEFVVLMKEVENSHVSISDYFMANNSTCLKSNHGYWSLDCCTGKCELCSKVALPKLIWKKKNKIVSFYRFEVVQYEKVDKETGKNEKK